MVEKTKNQLSFRLFIQSEASTGLQTHQYSEAGDDWKCDKHHNRLLIAVKVVKANTPMVHRCCHKHSGECRATQTHSRTHRRSNVGPTFVIQDLSIVRS